jgi:hypothetical protein
MLVIVVVPDGHSITVMTVEQDIACNVHANTHGVNTTKTAVFMNYAIAIIPSQRFFVGVVLGRRCHDQQQPVAVRLVKERSVTNANDVIAVFRDTHASDLHLLSRSSIFV